MSAWLSEEPKTRELLEKAVIVDEVVDTDVSEEPFGKRWDHELVILRPEHLAALQEGRLVAIDVRTEYVLYIGTEKYRP